MSQPRLDRRYEADQIARRVTEVASTLDAQFHERPLLLIAVLKGSSFFLADLARQMSAPTSCEYISVRREEGSDEILQIDFSTTFSVGGKPVLLLKDVVNTGIIETYLIDHLRSQGASVVRLAAIVDKSQERRTELAVDYPLFAADKGVFVGYGMEYQGQYAHLPYIAEVLQGQ